MRINADKPIHKYLQLKEIIKHHLYDGHYESGQKIPSENELMSRFHVSRSTVRQALAELVNEGVLYKEQGRGSFFSGKRHDEQHRSYLIGVIVSRLSFYIYPQIMQGVDDVAHHKNYNMVVGSSDVNPEKELTCLKQLLEKNIDGLLIEPSGGFRDFEKSKNFQILRELDIPVVFMNYVFDNPEISYISPNDVEGGFRATSFLVKAGHTRIACVCPNDTMPAIKRRQGYRKALDAYGIPYDRRLDKSTNILRWNEPGYLAVLMKELLALGSDRPTAIFFFNDDGAIRGYEAIRKAGLSAPDDISVMGFDDSDFATITDVPLTSMIHPKYKLGKWAAEILLEQIEGAPQYNPWQILINPTIAVRNSVKILDGTKGV